MKANVYVTLKREVLDPQGDAVARALRTQGFANIKDVRVGKLIEIETEGAVDNAALKSMCERLLANAVIEDFRIETLDAK